MHFAMHLVKVRTRYANVRTEKWDYEGMPAFVYLYKGAMIYRIQAEADKQFKVYFYEAPNSPFQRTGWLAPLFPTLHKARVACEALLKENVHKTCVLQVPVYYKPSSTPMPQYAVAYP